MTLLTERELDIAKGQIIFRPLDTPVRYEYAILTLLHRPPSRLATRVKRDWMQTLYEMLESIGAAPAHHPPLTDEDHAL